MKNYNIIGVLLLFALPYGLTNEPTLSSGITTVQTPATESPDPKAKTPSSESLTEESDEETIVNDNPFLHMGSSEMGIPVGEALDPPLCPPPPLTRSLGICYLKKCSSHQECSEGSACCFNGCIHSCIEPMDRPAAFDWIEDTSKVLPIFESDYEDSPVPFFPIPLQIQPSQFEAAVGEEELVHLPGGCFVTASRYKELKEFMKAPSIKECRCNEGEIVCDIRREKA